MWLTIVDLLQQTTFNQAGKESLDLVLVFLLLRTALDYQVVKFHSLRWICYNFAIEGIVLILCFVFKLELYYVATREEQQCKYSVSVRDVMLCVTHK